MEQTKALCVGLGTLGCELGVGQLEAAGGKSSMPPFVTAGLDCKE